MKLGITSNAYSHYGFEEGLRRQKQDGYGTVDDQLFISTESPAFSCTVRELDGMLAERRRLYGSLGIAVSQTHGPWRCPPKDDTTADRLERFARMARSLYGTAALGSPYMVVHPIMPYEGDDRGHEAEVREMNLAYYYRLAEEAKANGVTVALENMPFLHQSISSPEQLIAFVRELAHPNLRACLDTGHALVWGEKPEDAVRLFGKDLAAIHVHSNDGKNDYHWLPGTGLLDPAAVVAALREIGFAGPFSLETNAHAFFPDAPDLAARESALAAEMRALLG